MILDARDPAVSLERSCPIVIVGAGPAGMILAQELGKAGPVLLIESGGRTAQADVLDLYAGESVGIPYPLTATRARQFGGSTALWNGYCAQFDPQDFAWRDWVPHSGWPFGVQELEPYYAKAAALLHLGDVNFDAHDIARRSGVTLPIDNERVSPTVWRFGSPTLRCADQLAGEFESSKNITTLLHTNVVDIRLDKSHTAVTELRVRTLAGREGTMRADCVVLACGGLETPRLLLNADSQIAAGVGNARGLVGRYFMEHPHVAVPGLRPCDERIAKSWTVHGRYDGWKEYMSCLGLSAHERQTRRILNGRLHAYRAPDMSDAEPPRVGIFLEQAPNPDSRVTLSGQKDALGMRRLQLDWRLCDLDWVSFESTAQAMHDEFDRSGLGSCEWRSPFIPRDPTGLLYTNHHLGTTRMAESECEGVLDGHGRLHDLENLYVAGASSFPTGSWANPTFTVLALSLRMAAHLSSLGFH